MRTYKITWADGQYRYISAKSVEDAIKDLVDDVTYTYSTIASIIIQPDHWDKIPTGPWNTKVVYEHLAFMLRNTNIGRVNTIKTLRHMVGRDNLGLREAKEIVDTM